PFAAGHWTPQLIVFPAGVVDQLRRPVPGRERRIEPFQRSDARTAPGAPDRKPYPVDPRGRGGYELHRGLLAIRRLGQRAGVAKHFADRMGIERDDPRVRLDLLRDRADVVVG